MQSVSKRENVKTSRSPAAVALGPRAEIRSSNLLTGMAPNHSTADLPAAIRERLDPLQTRRMVVPLGDAEVTRAPGSGGYRFVISSEKVDLQGDIVVQAGLSPVSERIPAQVDHSGRMRDMIGYWDNIKTQAKRTLADLVLFDEEKGFEMANMVRALADANIRLAASIGFHPDTSDGGYELIRDPANEWVTGIRYLRSKLVEASVVVVPANPDALSVQRSLQIAKTFGLDAQRFTTFVTSESSQQMLRGMPRHDTLARGAAALEKANAILGRGSP